MPNPINRSGGLSSMMRQNQFNRTAARGSSVGPLMAMKDDNAEDTAALEEEEIQ